MAGTPVRVPAKGVVLEGELDVPASTSGTVLFAHGSGSSRRSPRNQLVGRALRDRGIGTLLIDLLTAGEDVTDQLTAQHRFDIPLLGARLIDIADWMRAQPAVASQPIGLFGASTGGAAALIAAAERPDHFAAVVSRGGRPDLAGAALSHVRAPTLLIVGERDEPVIRMNQTAIREMPGLVTLEIVPGAAHLFEKPGALERVAALAGDWFARHFAPTEVERTHVFSRD